MISVAAGVRILFVYLYTTVNPLLTRYHTHLYCPEVSGYAGGNGLEKVIHQCKRNVQCAFVHSDSSLDCGGTKLPGPD